MSLNIILTSCRELVSEGNVDLAIKKMLDFGNDAVIGSRNVTDLILIASRHNSVQEGIISGTISNKYATLESNKIAYSFLKLLNRIDSDSIQKNNDPITNLAETEGRFRHTLLTGDIPLMMKELNAIINSIPYDHWKADSESIFHIIIHLSFKKIGVDIFSEVHSAKGRCDLILQTPKYIYIIELKLNGTAQDAFIQIKEQGYLKPFLSDRRKKIALGINFSSAEREVSDYLVELIS